MNKTRIAFILLCCCMIEGAFAQVIEINGGVNEARTNGTLEFANVVLQTIDSTFVMGTTTDNKGYFVLKGELKGDYLLVVSSLGYKTRYVSLNGLERDVDLGNIDLDEAVVPLDNITVDASNARSYSDRKIVYPSDRQLEASTNGINLLQQLMLPGLRVNPLFNEVRISGDGEIQYRINGVKAEVQEIVALMPTEIIRIEYHDNPGLRYGNAEVVLDYIVRRPDTGGSIGLELSNSPHVAWRNNQLSGKINHKKSEFGVNYFVSHQDYYGMWRDNEERFLFMDGSVSRRKEKGEPGRMELFWQNLQTNFSYQEPEKYLFNATFRLYTSNQPHLDYQGTLFNMEVPEDRVTVIDKTAEKLYRPALDVYYQRNLPNDQTLVFNLVGTYNKTHSDRIYQERRYELLLTDVNNGVKGNKYSIIGEGIYERKIGKNRIGGGLRHTQSFSDNTYRGGREEKTRMGQAETYLYAEFRGRFKKLDYTLGLGVTRSFFRQEVNDGGYRYYAFNPRLNLHYKLTDRSFIRLRGSLENTSPSLSNLNAVDLAVDSLQIQRGNPDLTPYLRYKADLTYEYGKGLFYGNLRGAYEYAPNAIMDEKFWEGNRIIQTWNNQRSWQRLSSYASLRIGPVKDLLQVRLEGGVNHFISRGRSYSHVYTNWYSNLSVSVVWKRWLAGYEMYANWDRFFGETMTGGEQGQILYAGYRYKDLMVGAGVFNPFINTFRQDSENRSQYASFRRSMYLKESSRLFVIRLAYNFSFGRKFSAGQKKVNNADNDSGVMSTGK